MVKRKTPQEKVTFFLALDRIFQELEEYKEDPDWNTPPYLPIQRILLFLHAHEEWKTPFYAYTYRKGKTNRIFTRLIRMYNVVSHAISLT